jgi:hypothetical protein
VDVQFAVREVALGTKAVRKKGEYVGLDTCNEDAVMTVPESRMVTSALYQILGSRG